MGDSFRLQNTDSYNFRFLPLVSIFLLFCMSQKAELPSLTGHRTKTRKRDEKQVNNPTGFRDSVIEGLSKTGQEGSDITEIEVGVDLDAAFKFLDTAGNKLDYRRYGEVLLEILIAGGLLAPGGSYQNEGGDKPATTRACVFQDAFDIDRVKAWDQQVFVKLMRRYKYLEKMLVEEMKKILVYLKGFTDEHRQRLAQLTALWLCSGMVPPNTLQVVINEHQIKEIEMDLNEAVKKNGLGEHEAAAMIWQAVMGALDSNEREDLIQDQALRHLKQYIPLFAAFTNSTKSEMVLCNKIQEYCYDNQNLLKCFNKIILLFYKTEVLSEEVILKWYKDGHIPKVWTVFMEQLKKFIDWLEQAESEESSDEED